MYKFTIYGATASIMVAPCRQPDSGRGLGGGPADQAQFDEIAAPHPTKILHIL